MAKPSGCHSGARSVPARVASLTALLLLLSFPLASAPGDYEGRPVLRVLFEPRSQPLSSQEIARLVPFRPGAPLQLAEVRRAIEEMYSTGRYEDIRVDAAAEAGGVAVTFITEPAWFVGSVDITGIDAPPSASQVRSATRLELGTRYYPQLLTEAVEGIQSILRQNGLYQHRILPDTRKDAETYQIHFRFSIEPGPRASFASPELTGELEAPPHELIEATRWKGWLGWREVTQERLQEGVDRIRRWYRKRDHLMAAVRLLDSRYASAQNEVQPVIAVAAGPKISLIATGAKISRGNLQRLVPVFEEQSVDRDLLEEGKRNIEGFFQSRGYFHTTVSFALREEDPGHQVIEYRIETGPRIKLVKVDVEGNEYFDTVTIRERLSVITANLQFPRGRFDQNLISRDVNAITYLYESNGFRNVSVASEVIPGVGGDETEYGLRYHIREGRQVFIEEFDLQGVDPEDQEEVRYLLASIEGQPFSELSIAIDRDNVLAYYFERGYPDALFEWAAAQGSSENTIKLQFQVIPRQRKMVQRVVVQGLEDTRAQIVERQITLHNGDPLSFARMVDIQRRLYGLGVFSQVDMAIQNPEGEEPRKLILYDVEEAKKYSITGGIGAEFGRLGGTQGQDPAGAATFAPRVSFNVTRVNFRGRANTLSLKTRFSNIQQRGLVTWLAPAFRGKEKLTLSFAGLADESRDIRTFTARRLEGSVQLAQNISRIYTALYRYSYRLVNLRDLQIAPESVPVASQSVRIGQLSGTLIQDRRDDPLNASQGYYNTVDVGFATSFFGSETGFIRMVGRNSTYHRIAPRLVFARTTTFGWEPAFETAEPGSIPGPNIPLPERFFAGGASSHRGFPENQAGPRDLVTGFPIGGAAQLFNGLELRFPLLGENLGGVLFHDMGNVYTDADAISFRFRQRNPSDFNYMVQAVGFGIRYNTPIGPFRLDLAYGLNSPRFFVSPPDDPRGCVNPAAGCPIDHIRRFQFHLSLGQAF